MEHTARRRVLGSYYTPEWIARWMVWQALASGDQSANSIEYRILDPACGDGAFIVPVLNAIAESSHVERNDVPRRCAIVRNHVFGVDRDPIAIAALHQRVALWIGSDPDLKLEIADVIAKNFRCGNALMGADWATPDQNLEVAVRRPTSSSANVVITPQALAATNDGEASISTVPHGGESAICWLTAFPEVASAGGFDLVIGNPPYRRERYAKQELDHLAESSLGKRWRTARMDLWYYFFHRGLNLLKPKGRLSFIVNSYWMSSTAAKSLRERIVTETTIEKLVDLGAARLFRSVSGRHMIFQVRKAQTPQTLCSVLDLSTESRQQIERTLSQPTDNAMLQTSSASAVQVVPQSDLWTGGKLRLKPQGHQSTKPSHGPLLGEVFEVRQGMAENPPFVTRSAAMELGNPNLTGHGVFVLTADEIASLNLTARERALLRPYFALSTVSRFRISKQESHRILYLTRSTAPTLADFPAVAGHLKQFLTVLERRREVQSGKIAWWHLHWPREERLFTAPRILCLQMGHEPQFAFAERPTYVGFSMHVIVDRIALQKLVPLSLPALAAVLNSSRARLWFETHAKRRGAHLDISGSVLKQFPLPIQFDPLLIHELEELSRTWSTAASEIRLNEAVESLYST